MVKTHTPIIGIVGGIGAGKSTVAQMLAELGCVVADSDALARQALQQPEIRDTLVRWWGEAIVGDTNTREINRKAVAAIVFNDPEQRRRLEALTHPWIERRRKELFADAPASAPALVIDAPLIIEAGLHELCDAILYVDTDRATRIARISTTRGWDEAELARREFAQYPLDEKRRLADHIVVNTGDRSELQRQVKAVLARIIQTCGG